MVGFGAESKCSFIKTTVCETAATVAMKMTAGKFHGPPLREPLTQTLISPLCQFEVSMALKGWHLSQPGLASQARAK